MSPDAQANLHAISLIGFPILFIAAVAILPRRKSTMPQQLIALGATAMLLYAASPYFIRHGCREGGAGLQWAIVGPTLFLVLAYVQSADRRRMLAGLVVVSTLGLSCHATDLVHKTGWTGNPDWTGFIGASQEQMRDAGQVIPSDSEFLPLETPGGWLRDLPAWEDVHETLRRKMYWFGRRIIQPVWHSRLSGLYRYTSVPQDLWIPPGRLEEALKKLEVRDRPDRPDESASRESTIAP